jgi:hypothetical protein
MGWFSSRKERPDSSDASIRAVVLRHVVAYALMTPTPETLEQAKLWWTDAEKREFGRDANRTRDEHWSSLGNLKKHLSPSELVFSRTTQDTMTEMQLINASWRVESLTSLLWALNVVGEIPPYDTQTSPDLLEPFRTMDADVFIKNAALRSMEDINNARDIAESWHWRSRTRQLIEDGTPFPADPQMHACWVYVIRPCGSRDCKTTCKRWHVLGNA